MKLVKKLTALFLAIVMTMAMGITAFAADTYTITIKGDHVVTGHTYEAYQIFKGDLKITTDETTGKKTSTLSNVQWGDNIDADKFVKALKADTTFGDDFKDVPDYNSTKDESAAAVSDALTKYQNDSAKLIAFSKLASACTKSDAGVYSYTYLTGTPKTSTEKGSGTEQDPTYYEISGLSAGYYLVKDKEGSLGSEAEEDAYTRNILQVVTDVTVDAKASVPQIKKEIVEGNTTTDANTQSIGGTVNYKITSAVPDMTGYNKYFFVVTDTLSKGLTYDGDSDLVVKIGTTTLTKDVDYTVTSSVDSTTKETTIKVVFKNFIERTETAGTAITIEYTATVNQDAVLTDAGNPNVVKLTYSNNPNVTPKGTGDEPDEKDKDVVGETPEKKVVTYVTGLKLLKVDAQDTTVPLPDARFTISGTSQKVVIVNKEIFEQVATGTGDYYRLKDGSYTQEQWTEDTTEGSTTIKGTKDKYETLTKDYKKVTVINKQTVDAGAFQATGKTDANGVLTFEGLGEGVYTIEEILAPDGYNLLKDKITVTITADEVLEGQNAGPNWTVVVKQGNDTIKNSRENEGNFLFKFTIANNKGSILPSTGGMGTTVIYIAGIAMIVAAGVVVIARKRFA